MRRREAILGSTAALVAGPVLAQQGKTLPLVGYLSEGVSSDPLEIAWLAALRAAMNELGLADGRNVRLQTLIAEGMVDPLRGMAEELVAQGAAVIVATSDAAIGAAREATRSVPIVMAPGFDPVGAGFVTSLARPGGNVTGISALSDELWEKRASLLREVVPSLQRLAILANIHLGRSERRPDKAIDRLRAIGIEAIPCYPTDSWGLNFRSALLGAVKNGAQGLLLVEDPGAVDRQRDVIAAVALDLRLPAIAPHRAHVEAGLLMSYGADVNAMVHRVAWQVKRILEGVPPRELPVEQPTRFEFFVNLKTANALGLTLPLSILVRADEMIE